MGPPSQLSLLTSLTAYPLLLRLFSGPNPTPQRLSNSTKAISTIHSLLITLLALHFLSRPQWRSHASSPPPLSPSSKQNVAGHNSGGGGYPDDTLNPTISGRSEYGNAITAIEAGYLVQDTFTLLYLARLQGKNNNGRWWRNLDKTLATHHITIGTALLVLQYYIARNREAGIYIIVQFLLMNSSTPVLNLRWYLRFFAKGKRKAILLVDAAFVGAFFMARVWLVWKILADYGAFHGWSAWEAYRYGLRGPCKLGTGALLGANVGWWTVLVTNVMGRTRFTLGGQ